MSMTVTQTSGILITIEPFTAVSSSSGVTIDSTLITVDDTTITIDSA